MKKFFYAIIIIVLSISNHAYAKDSDGYVAQYKQLLSKYLSHGEKDNIKTTLVNYESWGQDPLHAKAMSKIQKINPHVLQDKEKMAFWINAYNLLTIDLIIKTGEKGSIKNQGSLFRNVWKSHYWKINNKKYSLDQIEHEILRPMGDSRIHMAINCASLSCPDLRHEPYEASKLEGQLRDQASAFIQNQTKGVKITKSGLHISKIFDWFAEDFGGDKGVKKFINQRMGANHSIAKYLDYNWKLNNLET